MLPPGAPSFAGPSTNAKLAREDTRFAAHGRRVVGDHACPWVLLHFRLGAAPVVVAGHRRLSRAGKGAGARRAVPDHRRALGLRLLRSVLLLVAWRTHLDPAGRSGHAEWRCAVPA